MYKYLSVLAVLFLFSCNKSKTISSDEFPKPENTGGMPLMTALSKRESIREFKAEDLSQKTLSNLLWAANGVNRPLTNGRTAPSANNKQEIEIYVANKKGVFFYDALKHQLNKVNGNDIRSKIGKQDYVETAPTILILVANIEKTSHPDSLQMVSGIDAGYVSQNIYLYCASFNLATVALAWLNYEELPQLLGLNKYQHVLLAHPVGLKK